MEHNNDLSSKSSQGSKEIDFEDKIISDPALTSLLNENREILVGDSLYKYTENGLYFCKKSNKEKMYRYLKDTNTNTERVTNKNIKNEVTLVADGIMRFVPMKIEALDPEYSGGGGSTVTSTPILTSPRLIKQNLEISYIETNSLFEHIFGASDKVEDYYSDDRRIQVSFWNQNYYFFSSVGCSARLQKREKLLGVSYWEKSYADIIELGVNDIQYDYKFNTPIFELAKYNYNTVFFEYKGVKYNINGQTILKLPTNGPRFIFDTGDPEAGLTIFIHNNQYDLLNAKELNKIIDILAKQFVNNLPSVYDKVILDNKIRDESLKYNVVKAPSLSNKITFKTLNVKWSRNNDNAITQYFDFNFLFTWKNSYEGVDDYLKGLNGSTAYSNVTADIYGAALHNGEWKGRRLMLQK